MRAETAVHGLMAAATHSLKPFLCIMAPSLFFRPNWYYKVSTLFSYSLFQQYKSAWWPWQSKANSFKHMKGPTQQKMQACP